MSAHFTFPRILMRIFNQLIKLSQKSRISLIQHHISRFEFTLSDTGCSQISPAPSLSMLTLFSVYQRSMKGKMSGHRKHHIRLITLLTLLYLILGRGLKLRFGDIKCPFLPPLSFCPTPPLPFFLPRALCAHFYP